MIITLRECVERLQELNNPTFRAEKVKARPEIFADPHMDPTYDSDDDGGESDSMTGLYTILSMCTKILIKHFEYYNIARSSKINNFFEFFLLY